MAHMSQERKSQLSPAIKAICKCHGIKATLSVRNHMTLRLNVSAGKIDFIGNYNANLSHNEYATKDSIQVNPYHYHSHFTGDALAFLAEVFAAMNLGNHNNSDIMTDYFDVGWYVDVNVGQWNKPYIIQESTK